MLKKHFRLIIGCLLLVFILCSVGIYLYFNSKASDIKNRDAAYSIYAAHTQAYNDSSTSNADNLTLIKKRSLPKVLLDSVQTIQLAR